MPGLLEVVNALYGSYRLAWLDESGYDFFDISTEGFWRSFTAIILIAPFFVLFALAEFQMAGVLTAEGAGAVVDRPNYGGHLLGLALQWFGFPLIMAVIARLLDLTANYARFIIVSNWASLPLVAVLFAPIALYIIGILGPESAATFNLFLIAPVLLYRWFVARTALEIPGSLAVAIVAFEFVFSMLTLNIALTLLA
jgi:hypothetical protein